MLDGETIVVFADDWGAHPSSSQHLLRRFLARNRVVWINTVGLRLPQWTLRDFRKIAGKLRHWLGKRPETSPDLLREVRPEVHDLPLVPLPLGRSARWLNAPILRRSVRLWLKGARQAFIISTLPLTVDLAGALPHATFVYYVVDDYGSWPGLGGQLVRRMDEEQSSKADCVIAASGALAALHAPFAREPVLYLPHGVDIDHFGPARTERAGRRQRGEAVLADVVFFGAIDERIDVALLAAVIASRPSLRFLIIGPRANTGAGIGHAPNVIWRDSAPYAQLPHILAQCSIAIMPYVRSAFGERLSPLKAREALAAGLPVVATEIPELRTLHKGVFLADSAAALGRALDDALAAPDSVPSLDSLASESWEARAEQLSTWLAEARSVRGKP